MRQSIALGIAASKTMRFLDYFRAGAPFLGGWAATQGRASDGSYVEDVSGSIQVKGRPITIEIRIRWGLDGSLASIEFEGSGNRSWSSVVHGWVERALADALSERMGKHYYRDALVYMGSPLGGEYWLDGFRIAPFRATGAGPSIEQLVSVECEVEAVDEEHARHVGRVKVHRFADLFSLFLTIGLRRVRSENRWVRLEDGQFKRAIVCPPINQLPRPTSRPRKGALCPLGGLAAVDRGKLMWPAMLPPLQPPSDIRDLFRAVHRLAPPDEEAFLGVASLARIALIVGSEYPSVQVAYWIAAVDALPRPLGHKAGFKEVVQRYCPEAPVGVVKSAYGKIRSAHFHAGALPAGEADEEDHPTLFETPERRERGNVTSVIPLLMYNVLVRWLLNPARP